VTPIDVETIERIFADALGSESFTRHGLRRGTWDVSRDCERPVPVTLHSRATGSIRRALSGSQIHGIELVMLTPCRRCKVCLAKKARLWRYRALAELQAAERSWFGTLTLSPDAHVWVDHVAATRTRDFWVLPLEKKFEARVKVMGIEVTKYLKRVRKNSGVPFRYLLVSEYHNSDKTSEEYRGWPHCHLLLHEYRNCPVRKDVLDSAWHHGFSQWRLTRDQEAAWYVSKYITKANDARTRASLEYGSPPHVVFTK